MFSSVVPLADRGAGEVSLSESRIMSLLDRCMPCVADKLRGPGVIEADGPRFRAPGVAARGAGIDGVIVVVASDSIRIRLAGGSRGVSPRPPFNESSLSLLRMTPWMLVSSERWEGISLPASRCDSSSGKSLNLFNQAPAYLHCPEDGLNLLGRHQFLPCSHLSRIGCGIQRSCP